MPEWMSVWRSRAQAKRQSAAHHSVQFDAGVGVDGVAATDLAWKLRGVRYLTPQTEELAKFITNRLRFLDFDQTCEWYRKIVPLLDNKGRALLGCNDRFFLLTGLLRRSDALHPWLFDRCREVERNTDGYLDLWARFHYKSSIGTFAGAIQEIMCDPDITIAIFSHTQDIAFAFLEQIKREFEQNDYLKEVYEDVLYEKPSAPPPMGSPKWSKDGFIVKRTANPRECTVEAHGLIDGMPTSRHYSLLIYDDVVTDKSVTNEIQIQKTTRAWEVSDNLTKHDVVRKWHFGTRWHWGDTYSVILKRQALKARIYPATDNGKLTGDPVMLTQERWDEIKKTQRSTVAAQMLLNPVAGKEAVFLSDWFKSYDVFPNMLNVYILVDPAKGKRRGDRNINIERSDRTAIAVVGIDQGGNKYLLDGYRHRMGLADRYRFIKQLYQTWLAHPGVQLVRVGYEQYGAQVDTEAIREFQERDGNYFELEELGFPREGAHSKKDRVERLEPDMRNGRFYLPAVVWHPDIGHGGDKSTLWKVWDDDDAKRAEAEKKQVTHQLGEVVYRPMFGLTHHQRHCMAGGQKKRIVRSIKRRDENDDVYDLTRAFMEEATLFPFAPHDDLIDAVARIYDMEPHKPIKYESDATTSLELLLEGDEEGSRTYLDS